MRIATTTFLILFAPAALAAQQSNTSANTSADASASASATTPARVSTDAMVTGDAAADARIEQALTRAEASGIATAGLESRVQMGRARGVSATEIATAIEQRVEALLSVNEALHVAGSAHGATELELGADAVESGARASQVAEVVAGFSGEARTRALTVLTQLAAEGRLAADVVATVRGALDAGLGVNGAGNAAAATGAAGATVSRGAAAAVGSTGAAAGVAGSATGAVGGSLPR